MPYGLTVKIRKAPGYTVVTPAGELDIATVPQLRECLESPLADHPALVIDLDQVSFCDATGLGVLAGAADRAGANGASLHLVCSRPGIRRLFDLAGLARRLPLARTLDEALAALPAAREVPAGKNRAIRPGRRPARLHLSRTIAGGGQPVPGAQHR
ncbi:MAG TPA: STAS domain-containing protein [Streptosporangiaceae bacterium]|jgi:anti-anti-sigma factor|nr:STAS domain-containing protein [Streptosporangiaceae bacterium]